MLIVFLNYIVFLSAKIAIKTETFLIKILCFTIYHFIEWLMPGVLLCVTSIPNHFQYLSFCLW